MLPATRVHSLAFLLDVLEFRASEQAEQRLYTFLGDEEGEETPLT